MEGSEESVQLVSNVTLSDMDHQEIFNLTQAKVHMYTVNHTHTHTHMHIVFKIPMHALDIHSSDLPHTQIEVHGRCNSTTEIISVEIPASSAIVQTDAGPCIVISGSGSLETYTQILRSAR